MTKSLTRKPRDFTEGPILPKIISFALPLIATAVLQHLFNTADTIVVGRWGGSTPEECGVALAAVGSCGSLINLIVNLFFGLAVGAGVCVAHDIGAKHYDDVDRVVHTAVLAALMLGVFVMAVGLVAARPMLILMKTDPAVLEQAVPYVRAYFLGVPANMLYNYCAAMLRSSGDTTRPLAFLSVAGVVNVVLNLVMVIVFHAGALGVGVATAASHWVACALIVLYMTHYDGPCKIDFKKLCLDRRKLRKIISIGLPAGIQGSLFSVSNVLIQSTINGFGPTVVAGNTAASNIDNYIYSSQNALYQTAMTFVGQNVGAHRLDRVRRSIVLSTCVVVAVGITLGGLFLLFAEPLVSIFAPDNPEVVAAGVARLSVFCTTYFICGLMEVGCGAMRGLGKSIAPMLVALVGSCLFRVVWIYTVFAAMPTMFVLYLSYPVSWGLTAAVHHLMYQSNMRRLERSAEGLKEDLA